MVCPDCGGEGIVADSNARIVTSEYWQLCHTCGGSGEIQDDCPEPLIGGPNMKVVIAINRDVYIAYTYGQGSDFLYEVGKTSPDCPIKQGDILGCTHEFELLGERNKLDDALVLFNKAVRDFYDE